MAGTIEISLGVIFCTDTCTSVRCVTFSADILIPFRLITRRANVNCCVMTLSLVITISAEAVSYPIAVATNIYFPEGILFNV